MSPHEMVAAGYGWEDVLVAHGPQWGRIWYFWEVSRCERARGLKRSKASVQASKHQGQG